MTEEDLINYTKTEMAKCAEKYLSGGKRTLMKLSTEKKMMVRNHIIVSILLENFGRNSEVNGIFHS